MAVAKRHLIEHFASGLALPEDAYGSNSGKAEVK